MADGSPVTILRKAKEVSFDIPKKASELIAKASYEAPKVISYPVGGKKAYQPAYMGNAL
jgi:hypothetical protein